MRKIFVILCIFLSGMPAVAQTWTDSLDMYGREKVMPPGQYKWDWGQATMLNAMVHLYNEKPGKLKQIYLDYIKTAMDVTYPEANGKHPNAVASGHGMAFLARVTGDQKYIDKANRIFADYLTIPRSKAGGVSHRTETVELWDDTIYMLSMFLLEMYRYTGDEKYIRELYDQLMIHKDKLADKKWGLWVHGYDDDNDVYDDHCSQPGWARKSPSHKSTEFWGRGNGWVVMAIADALKTVPTGSVWFRKFARELREITRKLPPLQDTQTGLWYQLPIYPKTEGNFPESSCTAMFAYGITAGLEFNLLDKNRFRPVADKAMQGLKRFASVSGGNYIIPSRVCEGTCIGDKAYYLGRKTREGINYAVGSFIIFGLEYGKLK